MKFPAETSESVSAQTSLPRPTDRRLLTQGVGVSPFCLGIVQQPEAVLTAYDCGINFFFISGDLHWPKYDPLRKGLDILLQNRGVRREDIVIAGVSYNQNPHFAFAPFLDLLSVTPSLRYLDIYVAGGCYRSDYAARAEWLGSLLDFEEVKSRHIGFTVHDRALIQEIEKDSLARICFVRLNPTHPGAKEVVAHRIRPMLVYTFNSMHGCLNPRKFTKIPPRNLWIPSPTDHYRYALTNSGVDGILCSLRVPEEIEAMVRALELGALSKEEIDYMEHLAARLR